MHTVYPFILNTVTAFVILSGSVFVFFLCYAVVKGSLIYVRESIRRSRLRKQRTITVDYKATPRSIEELTRTVGDGSQFMEGVECVREVNKEPQITFTITEQGWAHRSSACTLRGYEHTDGKIYLEPKPPIPEREICQCRRCRKWGYVVDEFTSLYTGICAKCSKESPCERTPPQTSTPEPDPST